MPKYQETVTYRGVSEVGSRTGYPSHDAEPQAYADLRATELAEEYAEQVRRRQEEIDNLTPDKPVPEEPPVPTKVTVKTVGDAPPREATASIRTDTA